MNSSESTNSSKSESEQLLAVPNFKECDRIKALRARLDGQELPENLDEFEIRNLPLKIEPLAPSSLEELKQILWKHGLQLESKNGGKKTAEDLFYEIQKGETTLTLEDGVLVRNFAIVAGNVTYIHEENWGDHSEYTLYEQLQGLLRPDLSPDTFSRVLSLATLTPKFRDSIILRLFQDNSIKNRSNPVSFSEKWQRSLREPLVGEKALAATIAGLEEEIIEPLTKEATSQENAVTKTQLGKTIAKLELTDMVEERNLDDPNNSYPGLRSRGLKTLAQIPAGDGYNDEKFLREIFPKNPWNKAPTDFALIEQKGDAKRAALFTFLRTTSRKPSTSQEISAAFANRQNSETGIPFTLGTESQPELTRFFLENTIALLTDSSPSYLAEIKTWNDYATAVLDITNQGRDVSITIQFIAAHLICNNEEIPPGLLESYAGNNNQIEYSKEDLNELNLAINNLNQRYNQNHTRSDRNGIDIRFYEGFQSPNNTVITYPEELLKREREGKLPKGYIHYLLWLYKTLPQEPKENPEDKLKGFLAK